MTRNLIKPVFGAKKSSERILEKIAWSLFKNDGHCLRSLSIFVTISTIYLDLDLICFHGRHMSCGVFGEVWRGKIAKETCLLHPEAIMGESFYPLKVGSPFLRCPECQLSRVKNEWKWVRVSLEVLLFFAHFELYMQIFLKNHKFKVVSGLIYIRLIDLRLKAR